MQVVPRDKPLFCGNPQENVTDCSLDLQCPSKTILTIMQYQSFDELEILKIYKAADFVFSPWKLVGLV